MGDRQAGRRRQSGRLARIRRYRARTVVAEPAGPAGGHPLGCNPDPGGGRRRRPGPAALDRRHPAPHPQTADTSGSRGLEGSGAAGLAGGACLPVSAAVRPQRRRHRGPEVADPARPVRRRGQLPGDGQHRRGSAGHQRAAVPRDDGAQLSEGRLVPRLGRIAAADAVLSGCGAGAAGMFTWATAMRPNTRPSGAATTIW